MKVCVNCGYGPICGEDRCPVCKGVQFDEEDEVEVHVINENTAHTVHADKVDFSLDNKIISFLTKDNHIISQYIERS